MPNNTIRQALLLLLIAALFILIFWNLRVFVPALLGAYTLYVLLRRPLFFMIEKWKLPLQLAAAILLLISFLIILLPIQALVQLLGSQLVLGFQNIDKISTSIASLANDWEERLGMQILTPTRISNLSQWAVGEASNLLNATVFGAVSLLITYFILWFMLTGAKKMETRFFNWLPLKPENIEYVRTALNNLVFSNALGIPLMGVAQAIAGLIGYRLASIDDLWFWVLVTFIAGMMPFLGVLLAFIPLSLVLLSKGLTTQAIFIFAYGFIVIGSVDNLARMWLLNKIGHTHPLITLFGVIIGLKLFGFVGFIFGPIMIAMFLLLLRVYDKEFRLT